MLILAERLRAANGGDLDESAMQAVAEATGAPLEYVRLAVKIRSEKREKSLLASLRSQFFTLDPQTRRFVMAGALGSGTALLADIEDKMAQVHQLRFMAGEASSHYNQYGVFAMLAIFLALAGVAVSALSRDRRTAAISGAIFGGGAYLMRSVFGFLLAVNMNVEPLAVIFIAALGAVVGVVSNRIVSKNRERLGLKDPAADRQDLLRQLHHLREKLHSGQQTLTFVSIDIVGSTKLKQNALDPLAVEFTFNEYQNFVERVVHEHRGRVHSTAGDGAICAFENPVDAFAAAKHVQAGILEVNTFRNKLGAPIVLRCGIHSGTVVTPEAGDITSVNFNEVIDIASHLEKAAPPGGIAVSEASAMQLPGGLDSVGPVRIRSQETGAAIWVSRNAHAAGMRSSSPPVPNPAS